MCARSRLPWLSGSGSCIRGEENIRHQNRRTHNVMTLMLFLIAELSITNSQLQIPLRAPVLAVLGRRSPLQRPMWILMRRPKLPCSSCDVRAIFHEPGWDPHNEMRESRTKKKNNCEVDRNINITCLAYKRRRPRSRFAHYSRLMDVRKRAI